MYKNVCEYLPLYRTLFDCMMVTRNSNLPINQFVVPQTACAFVQCAYLLADDDTDVAGSMKVLVETFLSNLPNCVNRELIDKVCYAFYL